MGNEQLDIDSGIFGLLQQRLPYETTTLASHHSGRVDHVHDFIRR
jgi:hypothetical protein